MFAIGSQRPNVPIDAKMPVASDQSAKISAPVVTRCVQQGANNGNRAETHQRVVERQVRSLAATIAFRHELPSTLGQEAVVAARDELRAVGESNPIGQLARPPVGEDVSAYVAAVMAAL